MEEAKSIGTYTRKAEDKVLTSHKYVSQASREGILALRRKYGRDKTGERLQAYV